MKVLMPNEMRFDEVGYSGPHDVPYLEDLTLLYAAEDIRKLDELEKKLLDVAFAVSQQSAYKFIRKINRPLTTDAQGKSVRAWKVALHFTVPGQGDIVLMIPTRVGEKFEPLYRATLFQKGFRLDELMDFSKNFCLLYKNYALEKSG